MTFAIIGVGDVGRALAGAAVQQGHTVTLSATVHGALRDGVTEHHRQRVQRLIVAERLDACRPTGWDEARD